LKVPEQAWVRFRDGPLSIVEPTDECPSFPSNKKIELVARHWVPPHRPLKANLAYKPICPRKRPPRDFEILKFLSH
jgi:hypothetical protein